MPIIRGEHSFDSHFTQIPNSWLRDRRLSYKARGLLAELLSHSIGFQVSIGRLAAIGVDGKDSIASAIQELENAGYLYREQSRNPNGTLAGNIWITQDPAEKPLAENPSTDNPLYKNTNSKNTETKNRIYAQFENFWREYPRRVGRASALKAFEKLATSDDLATEIIEGAKKLANDPNLPPMQYVPHPATWLHREGWLDEPYPERQLSREEKIERDNRERELKAQRQRAMQEDITKQMLEEEQKARANPPKRCEHDRVLVLCSICHKSE